MPTAKRAAHLHCDRQGEQAHVSDAKRVGSSKTESTENSKLTCLEVVEII